MRLDVPRRPVRHDVQAGKMLEYWPGGSTVSWWWPDVIFQCRMAESSDRARVSGEPASGGAPNPVEQRTRSEELPNGPIRSAGLCLGRP